MWLLAQPWFAYPATVVAVFLATYHVYPIIEEKFLNRVFGKKEEIKKYLDYMFIQIEDRKLDRLLILYNLGILSFFFLIFWPNILAGVAVGLAAFWYLSQLPYQYVKSMHEKRVKMLVSQLIEGLTIMANGIKAGLTVAQSMERVTENLPPPISQEFNLVLSQMRLGQTLEESLNEFAQRNPAQDIQMLVLAINILKETGGNLAETFSTIVYVIRERQKLEQKIAAMTAQGKMQGIVISAVPFVILGIFYFLDANFVKPLFTTTIGLILLFIVIGLVLVGGLVIKKIVTIRV